MLPFMGAVLRLVVGLCRWWWESVVRAIRSPNVTVTVNVTQGKLRGATGVLPDSGKRYQYFRGIPYARPPVGELRFKAPVPLECYDQPVLDCFVERARCLQYDQITKLLVGSEDGLFLNVHAPELGDRRWPVMVYIHGGGFMSGSGNAFLYDPVHFVEQGVVVVTFNYRLGPLGFLCLPNAGIPGNAGLHDQLLVLQWVEANIASFGGDPSNVTLFGESAGSKSAFLHYLSPVSRKYFHKVICQSGVALSDAAFQVDPVCKARKLAELIGIRSEDSSDSQVLDALTRAPAKSLMKYQMLTLSERELRQELQFPFRPVIETSASGVVTQHPLDAIQQPLAPVIPIIIGCNSGEGIVALATAKHKLDQYNRHRELLLPPWLNVPESETMTVAQKAHQLYFQGRPVDRHTRNELVNVFSDNDYITPSFMAARLLSGCHPEVAQFFYYLTFDGRFGNTKQLLNLSTVDGVCHGDDVFYMFRSVLNMKLPPDSPEVQLRRRLTKLWTNFAYRGNPSPVQWTPVRPDPDGTFVHDCMQIDRELTMVRNPLAERMNFWWTTAKECDRTRLGRTLQKVP